MAANDCTDPPKTDACIQQQKACEGRYANSADCINRKKNCEYPYNYGDPEETPACKYKKDVLDRQAGSLLFTIAIVCFVIILILISIYDKIISYGKSPNKSLVLGTILQKIGNLFSSSNKEKTGFNKVDDFVQYTVVVVTYIMLVAALIMLMTSSHYIQRSNELGENFEKQCNGIFIEKERADFHTYSCYEALHDYDTETGIYSNKRGPVRDSFRTIYVYLLSAIVSMILAFSILRMFIYFVITLFILSRPPIISIFSSSTTSNENKYYYIFYLILFISILVSQIFLFSLWINSSHYEDAVQKNAPYIYYKDQNIDNLTKNQIAYIVLIILVVFFGFNMEIKLKGTVDTILLPKIPLIITMLIVLVLVCVGIIIPLFTQSVKAFYINITTNYNNDFTDLNKLIINHSNWDTLRTELEKNITLDERAKMSPDAILPPRIDLTNKDTYKKYEKNLYMYLPHILNDNHIKGIGIPQELKTIIEPRFLAGEQSIELKEQFIKVHKRHNNNNDLITKDDLHSKIGKDRELLPYLKNDVRNDISRGHGTKAIELLNIYIVENDAFKKGNPLPINIIRKLEYMRNNTSIKTTVKNYTSAINITSTIILTIIAYLMYHNLIYPNDVDIKVQYMSMCVFVLLIILGIVGWIMKERWL